MKIPLISHSTLANQFDESSSHRRVNKLFDHKIIENETKKPNVKEKLIRSSKIVARR